MDNLLKLSLDNVIQSYEFEFTEVHKVWTRHTMQTYKCRGRQISSKEQDLMLKAKYPSPRAPLQPEADCSSSESRAVIGPLGKLKSVLDVIGSEGDSRNMTN